jgi:hypothetical protein
MNHDDLESLAYIYEFPFFSALSDVAK